CGSVTPSDVSSARYLASPAGFRRSLRFESLGDGRLGAAVATERAASRLSLVRMPSTIAAADTTAAAVKIAMHATRNFLTVNPLDSGALPAKTKVSGRPPLPPTASIS